MNPSTLALNDLGVGCKSSDCVKCVCELVSKGRLSRFRFGGFGYGSDIRDDDLMELWKTVIGCCHIREVDLYDDEEHVARQCMLLKQIITGLSQTQRDALDWRRVAIVDRFDHRDITDIECLKELVPSLNRK